LKSGSTSAPRLPRAPLTASCFLQARICFAAGHGEKTVRWITTIVVAGEFKMILATPSPVAGLHGVVVDQDLAEIVLEVEVDRAGVHMKALQVLAEMISHCLLPAGAW
jgi:hypothetical protein